MRAACASAALILIGACSVDSIDYANRECPCIEGWVCRTGVCVPEEEAADAGRALDAHVTDAGFDAGPRDAARADTGTPPVMDAGFDAGFDAGPPATRCDDLHAGAIFCEDFEGDLSEWTDLRVPTGGSVDISNEQTYLGDGALRTSTPMGEVEAMARATVIPELTSGDLYVRSWYYFESDFALTAIELSAVADSARTHHLVATTYPTTSDIHTHGFTGGSPRTSTPMDIPRGRWTCIELHVAFHNMNGSITLSIDGTDAATITDFDTVEPGGLTTIEAGIVWQHVDQVPAVVYVDEVVADNSPIGCD